SCSLYAIPPGKVDKICGGRQLSSRSLVTKPVRVPPLQISLPSEPNRTNRRLGYLPEKVPSVPPINRREGLHRPNEAPNTHGGGEGLSGVVALIGGWRELHRQASNPRPLRCLNVGTGVGAVQCIAAERVVERLLKPVVGADDDLARLANHLHALPTSRGDDCRPNLGGIVSHLDRAIRSDAKAHLGGARTCLHDGRDRGRCRVVRSNHDPDTEEIG